MAGNRKALADSHDLREAVETKSSSTKEALMEARIGDFPLLLKACTGISQSSQCCPACSQCSADAMAVALKKHLEK